MRAHTTGGTINPPAKSPKRELVRLLVLDDEPLIGASLQRALGSACEVVVIRRGFEALARLREGERFDLVLCDLMMPEMSGMEFFQELVRTDPEQASSVVFITGGGYTEAAQRFLESTPNIHLDKPLKVDQILALLGRRLSP